MSLDEPTLRETPVGWLRLGCSASALLFGAMWVLFFSMYYKNDQTSLLQAATLSTLWTVVPFVLTAVVLSGWAAAWAVMRGRRQRDRARLDHVIDPEATLPEDAWASRS